MNREELIFAQYRLFAEQKEQFVERSFRVNKFYLVLNLIIIAAMMLLDKYSILGFQLSVYFAVIGMLTCVLWWMNVDSYTILSKVKYNRVLEKLEKELPVQPYAEESTGLQELRTNKKMVPFSTVQKFLAIILFLVFFSGLLNVFVPWAIKFFVQG